MISDKQFKELIKLDGPLKVQSMRKPRRHDGMSPKASSSGKPIGLTPSKLLGIPKTPGKSPDRMLQVPDKVPQQRGSRKTPSKTPNKGLKHSTQDRFIPTRGMTDIGAANFALTCQDDNNGDRPPTDYEIKLGEAMKVDKEHKILSYKNNVPKPAEGYANNLQVVYTQKAKNRSDYKTTRMIPNTPDRILDAPELRDDYYLNLMDWSCNNQIAVALGNAVYLWNASTGKIVHLMDVENEEEYVSCVKWITEGNFLAVGTSPGNVELWDVEKHKLLRTMSGHAARVGALSWNSYICSSGSRSGAIHHHDVRIADHQVATLTGHAQEVCGLAWSPDGRYLASGGNDNVLHIWNRDLGSDVSPQQSHTYHQAAVKALAWCPWRPNILASGGGTADRHIYMWDIDLASMVGGKDTGSQVCSILFAKEHKEMISGHGYNMNQLSIWKYPDFQHIKDLTGHKERVLSMNLSPDGTMVASAAADQTIRIWKCFESIRKKSVSSAKSAKETTSVLLKPSIIR